MYGKQIRESGFAFLFWGRPGSVSSAWVECKWSDWGYSVHGFNVGPGKVASVHNGSMTIRSQERPTCLAEFILVPCLSLIPNEVLTVFLKSLYLVLWSV